MNISAVTTWIISMIRQRLNQCSTTLTSTQLQENLRSLLTYSTDGCLVNFQSNPVTDSWKQLSRIQSSGLFYIRSYSTNIINHGCQVQKLSITITFFKTPKQKDLKLGLKNIGQWKMKTHSGRFSLSLTSETRSQQYWCTGVILLSTSKTVSNNRNVSVRQTHTVCSHTLPCINVTYGSWLHFIYIYIC